MNILDINISRCSIYYENKYDHLLKCLFDINYGNISNSKLFIKEQISYPFIFAIVKRDQLQ